MKKSKEDFERDLAEQIHLLRKRCADYDKGDFIEAKQISVILRNFLHDTKKTTSILTHLSRKNMKFYDTSIDFPKGNLAPEDGLVIYKVEVRPSESTRITFEPPLSNGTPNRYIKGKVSFQNWWNRKIIDDKNGNALRRRDIVLTACHEDGGAHISNKLKDAYFNSRIPHVKPVNGGIGMTIPLNPNSSPVVNTYGCEENGVIVSDIISANIRQIAYEVLKSLEDQFPEHFKESI